MTGNILTARWSNTKSIVMGLITVLFLIIALITGINMATFIALIAIGGVTWLTGAVHSAVRFAQTKWRIKRHIHPTSISEFILGGGIMAIILLTFNSVMGYTTGFIALAVIILVKIGLNITRNAVLK